MWSEAETSLEKSASFKPSLATKKRQLLTQQRWACLQSALLCWANLAPIISRIRDRACWDSRKTSALYSSCSSRSTRQKKNGDNALLVFWLNRPSKQTIAALETLLEKVSLSSARATTTEATVKVARTTTVEQQGSLLINTAQVVVFENLLPPADHVDLQRRLWGRSLLSLCFLGSIILTVNKLWL